jgi:hypothetical protein
VVAGILISWLVVWLFVSLAGWMIGVLKSCLVFWLTGWFLAGWLIFLVGWFVLLISWYLDCLVGRLISWLICRFVSNSVVD